MARSSTSLLKLTCRLLTGIIAAVSMAGNSGSRLAARGLPQKLLIGIALALTLSAQQRTYTQGNASTAYDAVGDFSISANPNGAWTYGFTQTRGAAFNRMPNSRPDVAPGMDGWNATDNGPWIIKNKSGATINDGSRAHPPDMLNLDPSFDGRDAVLRWTAPAAGTYQIDGRFEGIDTTTTDVAILKNNTETVASGNINGKGQQVPFALTLAVVGGDTVDFSVGQGTGGSLFDGTGLAVRIAPPGADISVTGDFPSMAVNGTSAAPREGEDFSYTFRITNKGPLAAPRIRFTHTIPDGLTFSSLSTSLCSNAGQTVTCEFEGVGLTTLTVRITARPVSPRVVEFSNPTATVTVSGVSDPSPGDNTCCAPTLYRYVIRPRNDNFTDASVLPGGEVGSVSGTNVNATIERVAGTADVEPSHAGSPGGASVWYRWVAPNTGQVVFNTLGANFDTLLAVYERANIGAARFLTIASNDDTEGTTSHVTFRASAGVSYFMAIDGYRPLSGSAPTATGTYFLSWSQNPEITPAPVPQKITQLEPRAINTGSEGFTVTIKGEGFTDTSRVFLNGQVCSPAPAGSTATGCVLTTFRGNSREIEADLPAVFRRDPQLLRLTVRNGSLVSNEFGFEVIKYVKVEAPPGGTVSGSVTGGTADKPGPTVTATLSCPSGGLAACIAAPAIYDGQRSGTNVPPLPGRLVGENTFSNLGSNGNGGEATVTVADLISENGLGLIGPDGATLVGLDAASLIGPDGATIVSRDGAGLVGSDGASLRSGGQLVGNSGNTRPSGSVEGSGAVGDVSASLASEPIDAPIAAQRVSAGLSRTDGNATGGTPYNLTASLTEPLQSRSGMSAPAPATVAQAVAPPPVNGGWFLVRSSGGITPPVTVDEAGRGAVTTRFDATSTPRLSELTRPILFAVVQSVSIVELENVSYSVEESANGSVTVTITRSGNTSVPVTVKFATVDGSARAGSDYTAASGEVTFAAGETSKTVTIRVLDDQIGEGDETLYLRLSVAAGEKVLFGQETAWTIILKDDTDPLTYQLAEGATGSFFDLDIAVANPNAVSAPIQVTFFKPDGTTAVVNDTLPPTSRRTIRVDSVPGVEDTAVSTSVASTSRVPLLVERTMFWDANYYGGHTETAGTEPGKRWYFGEGSQGFFDTYVLLANANPGAATVTVKFLVENGSPVVKTYLMPGTSRFNVYTGAIPELLGTSFSIVVDSDLPISAERAMYFGTARFYDGGHESAGVAQPSTSWFHAEGATGSYFDTFLLVGNPNDAPATVTFTFLLDTGQVVTKVKTVPANARLTVNVEAEDALLQNAAVSTTVTSNLPVISERSMYWAGPFTSWFEAHNSFGVTETASKWGLAEGIVGGPRSFETYILLANPNSTATTVTLTFLRGDGSTVVKSFNVPATSRFNVHVNSMAPELANESFGTVIQSEAGKPIAVERALYWNALGVVWAGGTNATATKLQ